MKCCFSHSNFHPVFSFNPDDIDCFRVERKRLGVASLLIGDFCRGFQRDWVFWLRIENLSVKIARAIEVIIFPQQVSVNGQRHRWRAFGFGCVSDVFEQEGNLPFFIVKIPEEVEDIAELRLFLKQQDVVVRQLRIRGRPLNLSRFTFFLCRCCRNPKQRGDHDSGKPPEHHETHSLQSIRRPHRLRS